MTTRDVVGWIESCAAGKPPVDELIAAGYPIAAISAASRYTNGYQTAADAAGWWRARAACFGPDKVRSVDDVPSGIYLSALIHPDAIDLATAVDDPIRAGYVCPGWTWSRASWAGAAGVVAGMRAAADPAAVEAVAEWSAERQPAHHPADRPAVGDAAGWVAYCVGCGIVGPGPTARAVEAVAAGQLDPELELAIVLKLVVDTRQFPAATDPTVIGDALEAKWSGYRPRLILPPIIV